jgi:tRNA A22 N-methylase
MVRTELAEASELLASVDASGEAAERLEDIAGQLDRLSTADRGPDHGRLARIQTALGEIQTDVDDEAAATIDGALEQVVAYRETVEGI